MIERTEGSTTRHLYSNDRWQCLEERATESGDATIQFVWGTGYVDALVRRDRDANASSRGGLDERLYAAQDALYNVSVLVDTAYRYWSTRPARFRSDSPTSHTGKAASWGGDFTAKTGGTGYGWKHRFTGRRLDPGTRLQLNRRRYYHQQLGRWRSRDPIGYEGSPWNLYAYTFAQPLVTNDPTGLYAVDSNGNRICGNKPKPRTDDECCDDAKAAGLDNGDGGGVVCCDGRKVSCNWHQETSMPDFDDIIDKCTKEHEDTHHADIPECSPTIPGLTRPGWRPDRDEKTEECKALRVTLKCLERSKAECKTDECKNAVQSAYVKTLAMAKVRYKCLNLPKPF